jgi:hypothetical protein
MDRASASRFGTLRITAGSDWPGKTRKSNDNESWAHQLEESQSLLGRVARGLFIKGWMGVIVILGLLVAGLVGGFAGSH